MMRERAWRATGRRKVAGTRMARLDFPLILPKHFFFPFTQRNVE